MTEPVYFGTKWNDHTCVESNSNVDSFGGQVWNSKCFYRPQESEAHFSDIYGVLIAISDRDARNAEIPIAYGFDFVAIVFVDDGVEGGVEVIQEVHDLQRGTPTRQRRKWHHIRKEDCRGIKGLRFHALSQFEFIRHGARKHAIQQNITLLFFFRQFPSSTFNFLLQIRGVLLQD